MFPNMLCKCCHLLIIIIIFTLKLIIFSYILMENAQNPPCADCVCRCEDVSRSLFSFRAGVRQPALVHSRKGFVSLILALK